MTEMDQGSAPRGEFSPHRNPMVSKNIRDVTFPESHFHLGDVDFRSLCAREPEAYTREDIMSCVGNCLESGFLLDGPLLAGRLRAISDEFSTSELIEGFLACVSGAATVLHANHTRVAGNFLDIAACLSALIVEREDFARDMHLGSMSEELVDLRASACDAAVEKCDVNPELALACIAIARWAQDMESSLKQVKGAVMPEGSPSYWLAGRETERPQFTDLSQSDCSRPELSAAELKEWRAGFIAFLEHPELSSGVMLWDMKELTPKQTIKEVRKGSDIGNDLLRGFVESQRGSVIDYFSSMESSEGRFTIDGKMMSPAEAALEVRNHTEIGRKLLRMHIDDLLEP